MPWGGVGAAAGRERRFYYLGIVYLKRDLTLLWTLPAVSLSRARAYTKAGCQKWYENYILLCSFSVDGEVVGAERHVCGRFSFVRVGLDEWERNERYIYEGGYVVFLSSWNCSESLFLCTYSWDLAG